MFLGEGRHSENKIPWEAEVCILSHFIVQFNIASFVFTRPLERPRSHSDGRLTSDTQMFTGPAGRCLRTFYWPDADFTGLGQAGRC